jgi:sec-independent protein translocase protein TatB
MFDIGFSELVVIGVVALVVIGPEKLPRVARTAGVLFGRMQRYVNQVKADINREMETSELSKVKSEFESAARSFQSDVESTVAKTEQDLREVESSIARELKTEPGALAEPSPEAPAVQAPTPSPEAPAAHAPTPSPQLELAIDDVEPAGTSARPGP